MYTRRGTVNSYKKTKSKETQSIKLKKTTKFRKVNKSYKKRIKTVKNKKNIIKILLKKKNK